MRQRPPNSGFTLIELIVVIVILGILAATALPRFIDLSGDARRATVEATGGAFTAGIQLIHAKWLTAGSPGAVQDFLPITSTTGSGALSIDATAGAADYQAVYNGANNCTFINQADTSRNIQFDSNTGQVVINN